MTIAVLGIRSRAWAAVLVAAVAVLLAVLGIIRAATGGLLVAVIVHIAANVTIVALFFRYVAAG